MLFNYDFNFPDVKKTGIDLDKKMDAALLTALPDGQAAVTIDSNDTVVRLNKKGDIVYDLYTGVDIRGLQVKGSHLFVLHQNGTVVKIQVQDGVISKVFKTGSSYQRNYASHHSDTCNTDDKLLLFVSQFAVYSYNISSQTLKLHIENLGWTYSVSPGCVNGSVVYVVTERDTHMVTMYNATWSNVTSFGGLGLDDGQLNHPRSAVISDHGQIIVADMNNARVSMFNSDGQFVKHLIIYNVPYYDGRDRPMFLSIRGSYLWIGTHGGRLTRYIL